MKLVLFDIDGTLLWSDGAGRRAMEVAGITPQDLDVAEIYDSFSFTPLIALEGFGICGPGEAGDWVLEGNAKLQNQIKGAMGYPVAVLVTAVLVFLGMTIFLIPTFAGIFEDLGAELPLFTQLMVDLSKLLRSSFSLLLVLAMWLTRLW